MKVKRFLSTSLLIVLSFSGWIAAQPAAVSSATVGAAASVVPTLINFSGVLTDLDGKALVGVQGVTFLLYNAQLGGNPLWMETQNVTPSKSGQYTATLGTTTSQGLPADIFSSGEARWLAVQIVGQPEQPRVLLVAVPYALKAADAQTIGGLPPSAFVLAAPTSRAAVSVFGTTAAASQSTQPPVRPDVTGSGAVGYVPLWDSASDIVDSVLFQSGSGSTVKIGINNATPAATLDVGGNSILRGSVSLPNAGTATATAGKNSQPFGQAASAFNTSAGKAVTQTFEWLAEPVNNDTATATATLNLLFGQGTTKPAETGLHIASNGLINFATGQTFPGTGSGTITGVTAGTDLKGGGASGTVTLNLDTTRVPQLATNNTFTGTQTINNTTVISGSNSSGLLRVNNTIASGNSPAVLGISASTSGYGVQGSATAASGTTAGVYGITSSSNGFGVEGIGGTGVYGASSVCTVANGCPGGYFVGNNGSGAPFYNGGDGVDSFGGTTGGTDVVAGYGMNAFGGSSDPNGTGGGGPGVGGYGGSGGQGGNPGEDGMGGLFYGGDLTVFGDGVDAYAGSGLGGLFIGTVVVAGTLEATVKEFKIDHPLDPANKYLVHASIESSEMLNLYTGNITTDAQGNATVQLPDWFEELNTDFRYQLTVIGQFAQAIVGQKIDNHQFQIRTSVPNVEVSWQVTGVRQDAYAKAHPLVVEEEKDARLRGFYLHPELFGAAPERQIEWARHPHVMKQMKQRRAVQRSLSDAMHPQPQAANTN